MMKIVLTGNKGFIGSHYYDFIVKNSNISVSTADIIDGIDLCDYKSCEELPDCDVLIHMAATNGTKLFYEQPTRVSFNNTLPTFNLLKRYIGTKTKFVFTSTCEIFNGTIDDQLYGVPTDENVPVMFKDILNPRWSYSLPKALGENLISNSGLDWLVVRYFNVYGPRQKDHFISEFVDRVKKGEYYIKGDDTRSFCYVDDAIKLTHSLVINANNQIVNVGNQEETKISEVAKLIMDLMGVDPQKLQILPAPKGSATRRCPEVSKCTSLTKIHDRISLREGLRKTLETLV